jgi:hypothetical protein
MIKDPSSKLEGMFCPTAVLRSDRKERCHFMIRSLLRFSNSGIVSHNSRKFLTYAYCLGNLFLSMKQEEVVVTSREPWASVLAFGNTICKTKAASRKEPKYGLLESRQGERKPQTGGYFHVPETSL